MTSLAQLLPRVSSSIGRSSSAFAVDIRAAAAAKESLKRFLRLNLCTIESIASSKPFCLSPSRLSALPTSRAASDAASSSSSIDSASDSASSPPASTRRIDVSDPNFRCLFTPELESLISIFRRHDHELRIAGGAVRDILSGRRPGDVDFATTATPAEMLQIFAAENVRVVHDRGAAHGTLMVRLNDKENFEVTTSRIHVQEEDDDAAAGSSSSKSVGGGGFTRRFTRDWYLDSCQRDLTINAMFLTLDGDLVDYHRGEEDLRRRRIRFVGQPRHRIREDHQRILRYFRFRAQLAAPRDDGSGTDGAADEETASDRAETLAVLGDEGPGLKRVSGMRIWPEFKKILANRGAGEEMRTMWELDLLRYCGLPAAISEERIDDFARKFRHSFDLRPQPVAVLSPLFSTKAEVEKLCRRTLNVSKGEQALLLWLIQNRSKFASSSTASSTSTKPLKDAIVDDVSSLPHFLEWLKVENDRERLAEIERWSESIPVLPVSAFTLMMKGFQGGQAARNNLAKLNQLWKDSEFTLSKDELMRILEEDVEKNRS